MVGAELAWMADALRFSCRVGKAWLDAGFSRPVGEIAAGARRGLAHEVGDLAERLREVWLERNRPGGLEDSAARLLAVRELLAPTPTGRRPRV